MEKFRDKWVDKKQNGKIALVVTLILIGLIGVLLIIISNYEDNFMAALFYDAEKANMVIFCLGMGIAIFGFLDAILLNVPTKKEKRKKREEKTFENLTQKNVEEKVVVCSYCGKNNNEDRVQCKYCNASLKRNK